MMAPSRGSSSMDQCKCATLSALAVVDMGQHEEIFRSLTKIRKRGDPCWWLYASECSACKTLWVVAQEERQNDVFIMRKLDGPAAELLMRDNVWPPDFERYEALLEIGRDYGRAVRFLDIEDSSLPYTMADLARERPGIAVSRLAWLLNLAPDAALDLARKVVAREGVDIALDA
jgi:hypothetical protein